MICERANTPVQISEASTNQGNKLPVLEGVFCEFGVLNVNERIYEEKEYLPHLTYLMKAVTKGNLIGELDHPKEFTPKLNSASHKIIHLEYDKGKRQIWGKVQLLNTDAGRNAQALLEGGVQLSISSRAAGTVSENKKVKINRIFAYDLVAQPGFANAQLNQINESLGFDPNSTIQIYDMGEVSEDMELDTYHKLETEIMPKEHLQDNEYVTSSTLQSAIQEMRELIHSKFDYLGQLLESNGSNGNIEQNDVPLSDSEKIVIIEERLHNLAQYTGHIVQKIQEIIDEHNIHDTRISQITEWADEVAFMHNKLEEYVSLTAQGYNKIEEFLNEEIVPSLNNLESNTNSLRDYIGEEIVPHCNVLENYVNRIIVPAINKNETETEIIGTYLDEAAKFINNGIMYSEKNAMAIKEMFENVDEKLNELDHINESTDILFSNMNLRRPDRKKYATARIDESATGNFSENSRAAGINANDLSLKIDAILESAKKQTVDRSVEDRLRIYITALNESDQKEYLGLGAAEKQKVDEAIINSKPLTPEATVRVIRDARVDYAQGQDYWLREIPETHKAIWESVSADVKQRITDQAKSYRFTNRSQVVEFWNSRQELMHMIGMNQLNESRKIMAVDTENRNPNNLGYSKESINAVADRLKQKNRGY